MEENIQLPGRSLLIRILAGTLSAVLYILSVPMIRNFLWGKLIKKGNKIIDVDYEVKK